MKRKLWNYHLVGSVLAAILSISVAGCLITGFDLKIGSMISLLLWCGVVSVLCALLFRFRYGSWILLSLMASAALIIDWEPFLEELWALLHIMTSHYHDIYDWPILGNSLTGEIRLPFMALSTVIASAVTYCWCRKKHIVIALLGVILPVAPAFFTIDTVPDTLYLYLLILGVSLLLLTDWIRRNSPAQCVRLIFRVLIPVAAALAFLFYLNPREDYVNKSSHFKNEITSWFTKQETPEVSIPEVNIPEAAISKRLRLRNVGPRNPYTYPVMSVISSTDSVIYLRGQDYDVYTGTGWEATEDRTETFTFGGETTGTVTVTTYGIRNILYVPYYSTDRIDLRSGSISNRNQLQSYDFVISADAQSAADSLDISYTDLPEATYRWAKELSDDITAGIRSEEDIIQAIRDYVRSSAIYDKSTGRMDSGWNDFAHWFLSESDTGYCVHFATAATVLLRAAGIPARYVEGYMVRCSNGESTVATNQDAHAWAEYYDMEARVWQILEATPADESSVGESTEEDDTEQQTDAPDSHTASTTEPTTKPGAPGASGDQYTDHSDAFPPEPFQFPQWTPYLIWGFLVIAAFVAQAKLRIRKKRRLWNRGKANQMTLFRWNQCLVMSRWIPCHLPEQLEQLAQKAKFSQHTISREELEQFDQFKMDAMTALQNAPWQRRFFLRWILAIDP